MGRVPLEPLEGYTVGVTADRRAGEQAELLRRRGARVIEAPTIATAYLGSDERLRHATEEVIAAPPDVLVVTTGIGIRAWFEAAQSWGLDVALLDALAGARVVSRGPKAAAAAQALGLEVWATAPDERMTGVRTQLAADATPGMRVAVQSFGDDTHDVAAALAGLDAVFTMVPVYRWQQPADVKPAENLVRAAIEGRVHAITFTSAPAVRNLFAIADGLGLRDELRDALKAMTDMRKGFDEARQAAVAARRDADAARAAAEKVGAANEATSEKFTDMWKHMLAASPPRGRAGDS
ncbi:MAG TPA: uroporphyrinogen-III synthase, partial [Acidimicrobiia bacterium]|nr:uroporphyrinogen-III synthase [Acidimicrobiia bacterium]